MQLAIKFLRHFVTSFIIHLSKKLVYWIDSFFTDHLGPSADSIIECPECHEKFRIEILKKINVLDACPDCGSVIDINPEVLNNDGRRFSNRGPGGYR